MTSPFLQGVLLGLVVFFGIGYFVVILFLLEKETLSGIAIATVMAVIPTIGGAIWTGLFAVPWIKRPSGPL